MQTIIQKWGNSQGIRIPKAFLDALGMSENDVVELDRFLYFYIDTNKCLGLY